MNMFSLDIKTDNAAFGEDEGGHTAASVAAEVARILRELAQDIENGGDGGAVMDLNGNKVGRYRLEFED